MSQTSKRPTESASPAKVVDIAGTGPVKTTPSYSPVSGEQIGETPLANLSDLATAIDRGRQAQKVWATTPVRERARIMRQVRDAITADADKLAEIISDDNGKTRTDAMAAEVVPAAMATNYYASHAHKFLADRSLHTGNPLFINKRSRIVRVPFGVVGIISPWNYPFAIPFSEVVMALMAGNAVVLKVASQTLMVGQAIERVLRSGGIPEGIFTHINLPGAQAGPGMLEAGVDKLFFTGSVPVGKELMAKAAETLTPVSLELGGNDAMLVCPDADLDRAAAGAVWAGLQNCGQSCGGVERIYVHHDIYDAFLDKLTARVRALRVGADQDFEVDLGAMTTTRQMDLVRSHIDEALEHGAVVHAQSPCPDDGTGQFLPATVLTEVNHEMRVMREETFGPVLGVMKVQSMDQAVELANDSDLGLTGSVWSRDRKQAHRLARLIQAGAITLNDHLMNHGLAETPWGGFKQSGIGRTHGDIGFSEMTEPQVIVDDWMPGLRKDMWWHPHGEAIYQGLRGVIEVLYGGSTRVRLKGLKNLLKIFGRSFKVD